MAILDHHVRDSDVIDTRDLGDVLSELEAQSDDDTEAAEDAAAIRALFDEISDYGGDTPEDGIQLIADDYFETYARELAEDVGAIPADTSWPCTCIDWERAARELRMDYMSCDIDGRTYWYR